MISSFFSGVLSPFLDFFGCSSFSAAGLDKLDVPLIFGVDVAQNGQKKEKEEKTGRHNFKSAHCSPRGAGTFGCVAG